MIEPADVIHTNRAVSSYVDAMLYIYPDADMYAEGPDFEDLVVESHHSPNKDELDAVRVNLTKLDWVRLLFDEANQLQSGATSVHTITQTTTMLQRDLYRDKYEHASAWLAQLETAPDTPPPPMIKNETDRTGEDPLLTAQAVVANFLASDGSLANYFGHVEGERRVVKQRILDCTTVAELEAVAWADWPTYEPLFTPDS